MQRKQQNWTIANPATRHTRNFFTFLSYWNVYKFDLR